MSHSCLTYGTGRYRRSSQYTFFFVGDRKGSRAPLNRTSGIEGGKGDYLRRKMRCSATLSSSKSNQWYPKAQINLISQSKCDKKIFVLFGRNTSSRKIKPLSCSLANPSSTRNITVPPLVVVGSANADIYVEIDRLPDEGETISAKTGQTLAGGKGANQAVCAGRLSYPTYFVGQIGEDAHGKLIADALAGGGVYLDYLKTVSFAPTGHAVVMLQTSGQNSIIIVGGANMSGWPKSLSDDELDVLKNAGIVLLQREIPDFVNLQVAKVRKLDSVSVFNSWINLIVKTSICLLTSLSANLVA